MARRRFGDSRGRGAGLSDSAARDLFPRFGLNEVQRSQSTESYNRRKPVLLSTGTPELAADAVTNPKLATNSTDSRALASGATNAERAVGANNIQTGVIKDEHVSGRFAKTSVPGDTAYKVNGKVPASDLNVAGLGSNPTNDEGKAVDIKSFGDYRAAAGAKISKKADKNDLNVLAKTVSNKYGENDTIRKIKKMVKPGSLRQETR